MINLITIRDYEPTNREYDDEKFLYHSLLAGVYYGDANIYERIRRGLFVRNYRNVVNRVLSHPTTRVRFACIKDDPGEVKGYSIVLNEGKNLFWVYVRTSWRKHGIARLLVPNTIKEVSNLNPVGESILKKHKQIEFNPFV